MKKSTLLMLIIAMSVSLSATIEWAGYTCPYQVKDICEDGNMLWLATNGGLVNIDKTNGEHQIYNTTNSGLSTNFLTSVEMDSNGNLWIGTSMGYYDDIFNFFTAGGVHIWHADGSWSHYNCLNSSLPDNLISDIKFDSDDNAWIATARNGLAKLSTDGSWSLFDMYNTPAFTSNKLLTIHVEDSGRIWIGSQPYFDGENYVGGGLTIYEDNDFTNYNSILPVNDSHYIFDIFQDENDVLWFAAAYEVYFQYDGVNCIQHQIPDLGMGYANPSVRCIIHKDGITYLGTSSGLTIRDGNNWTQYNGNNSIMGEYNIASLHLDDNEKLWCGSTFWGLYSYQNNIVEEFSILDENSGIHCPYIDDIAVTDDGHVWIANGYNLLNNGVGGLVHFDGVDEWEIFDFDVTDDFLYNDVLVHDDKIYAATGNDYDQGGIIVYDQGNWTRYDYYTTNAGFPFICADHVAIDGRGTLYAARCDVNGGISYFDGNSWTTFDSGSSGLVSNEIYCLLADPLNDDAIWIGTKLGLHYLENNDGSLNFTHYHPGNSALSNPVIFSLNSDPEGNIWAGNGFGAAKFDGSSWTNYNSYLPYLTGHGVSPVYDIQVDEYNRIWFATDEGIVILDGEDVYNYTTENSPLPVNSIHNLALDTQNGMAYIGTYGCGFYVAEYTSPTHAEPIVSFASEIQHTNYPDPFNPSTTIKFDLPTAGKVAVDIFNVKGQKVAQLINSEMTAGVHTVVWDGMDAHSRPVSSGMYLYKINFNDRSYMKKMMLIK